MSNIQELDAGRLASHQVTQRLLRDGLTEQDLGAIRLLTTSGLPYAQWRYTCLAPPPDPITSLYYGLYAILKWLDSDPPDSRDRDDAVKDLSLSYLGLPLGDSLQHRTAQQIRARKPRGRVTEDGTTLQNIIDKLARDHPEEKPKDLWPRFIGALDGEDLAPVEGTSPKAGNLQLSYTEQKNGKPKTITHKHFAKLVNDGRKKAR